MISDEIQQQLERIGKDTSDADRQLFIQRNKLMKPIYAKRREILKKVPNFWGTAVSIPTPYYATSVLRSTEREENCSCKYEPVYGFSYESNEPALLTPYLALRSWATTK
jgi:hypothetical protein